MNKFEKLCISVIVPIYNAEAYLEMCVTSVLEQSYRNLEIILVDDGSTDRSYDICKNLAEKDSRIRVIHQKNSGAGKARENGISCATGDYITFVDSDDYIDKDAYWNIILSLKRKTPDMVVYGLMEEDNGKSIKKINHFQEGRYEKKDIEDILYPKMLSYGPFFDFGILPNLVCKMIRTEFFKQVYRNISANVIIGEDADVVFQLLANAKTVQIIDYMPYHYCKRNDSTMWKKIDINSIISLETDLKTAFQNAGIYDIMKLQLRDYISFVTLLKSPQTILKDYSVFADKSKRIALYGAGGFGQALYEEMSGKIELWVDQYFEKYQKKGLSVQSVRELIKKQDDYDAIFIAILNIELCVKVKEQLEELGIKKDIVYYNAIFE